MSADANSAFRKKLSSSVRSTSAWLHAESSDLHQDSVAEGSNYSYDLPPSLQAPFPTEIHPSAEPNSNWLPGATLSMRGGGLAGLRLSMRRGGLFRDQMTPLRLAGHLSVLAVAATILFLSQYELPALDISLRTIPDNALTSGDSLGSTMRVANAVSALDENLTISDSSLQRAAVPFTVAQERGRTEIQRYRVEAGDTVLGIAAKFGLQPETIQWSNSAIEQNPDLLQIGDELNILPVDGILHTVGSGDTLSSLANKYKTDVESIVNFPGNGLTDVNAALVIGSQVVVPGGVKPYVPQTVTAYSAPVPSSAVKGSGSFSWPASGSVSQQFWSGHQALDIGSWTGAPVKAADGGYVALAGGGWNGGYGNHIIVDHGNGFVTLYAHLNSIFVRPGENVARGQQLGTIGNTGNSTGPHLHFEIRYQDVPRNPYTYLP